MAFLQAVTGAWGLLPLAVPAMVFVAIRLGALAFPDHATHRAATHRAVGGAILAVAFIVVGVRLLGAMHLFTPGAAALSLAAITLALGFLPTPPAAHVEAEAARTKEALPMVLVACAAIGVAVLAARWLPVWQWDSLGYHLPFVNFFLTERGQSGVSPDIPYLGTYPHNVELFVVALRAMLPDDRLVDLAQMPLGIVAAVAVSGIARLYGAERAHALAAGCAWLLVPAVFLQLPTNYVDVGSAAFLLSAIYFLLAPPSPRTLLVAGVALGLYLGSKSNAPIATALLGSLLVVRGLGAKLRGATLLAVVIVLALGAESYVVNLVRHGNPNWPVEVTIGPWRLPGAVSMAKIIAPPAAAPRAIGPLPLRVLVSWTNLTAPPAFDMRIGGYGPLFLAAFPFALITLVQARTRSVALWAALAATLATPDPAVARWIFAFPAMILALASPHLSGLKPRARTAVMGLAAALGIFQIAYAWPGLTGDGPRLLAYARMSDDERARAVGADGPPTAFIDVRKRVGNDETFAFDFCGGPLCNELPYLAWESDLRYRVVWIPDDLRSGRIGDFLEREKARVFMAHDEAPAGHWAKAQGERVARLFSFGAHSVYERRNGAPLAAPDVERKVE